MFFIKAAKVVDVWGNKEENKVKIPTEASTADQLPQCGAGRSLQQIYVLRMKQGESELLCPEGEKALQAG